MTTDSNVQSKGISPCLINLWRVVGTLSDDKTLKSHVPCLIQWGKGLLEWPWIGKCLKSDTLENIALSKLLWYIVKWVGVWDYFCKLWWATLYSINCSLILMNETIFNTLFCFGGMIVLNAVSKKLQITNLMWMCL